MANKNCLEIMLAAGLLLAGAGCANYHSYDFRLRARIITTTPRETKIRDIINIYQDKKFLRQATNDWTATNSPLQKSSVVAPTFYTRPANYRL